MNHLKSATRQLLKNPGFTAVAVISLALGIGANTAIFSLINAILLRSLPVPNPQELRVVEWSGTAPQIGMFSGSMRNLGGDSGKSTGWLRVGNESNRRTIADAFTYPQYLALREQLAAQADLFGYADLHNVTIRARHDPYSARGLMVTANFLPGLGVRPVLGRWFTPDEDQAGATPTAAITYECWEQQFDLSPSVIGQSLTLNGTSYMVVGVVPREFMGVGLKPEQEFYVPMSAQPHMASYFSTTSPGNWWIKIMARVRPGVEDAPLRAALDVAFAAQASSSMEEPRIELSAGRAGPAYDRTFYRKPLLILLAVVGTVLLVACANLAGLLLARGATRQHEYAVRAAIGAGRGHLIREAFSESLLLALVGGGAGVLLALWGRTAVSRLLAGSAEGLRYDTSLDATVLGFTLGIVALTALLAGLLPALRAGRADPLAGLKDRTALGSPRLRAGRFLVTAQLALSVLLVSGAGLYVRTLVNLTRIHPGFNTENLLLFNVAPGAAGLNNAATTAFYERTQDALSNIPGVRSCTLVQYKLLAGMMSGGGFFKLPAHPEIEALKPQAHRLTVGETFFTTLQIPILQGRGFTAADTDTAPKVVVVNDTFVRTYLPTTYPVGQLLRAGELNGKPIDWQIVGVSSDAKYTGIKTAVPPTVYFSFRQDSRDETYFALRTAVPPLALVPAARKAVAAIDANVPLSDITTQAAVRDQGISQETMFATLCAALAGLAVLLACIGLYGLMAYNVARRTGEIGIRMALGATRHRIAGPILREALLLAATGVAFGLPTALALSRFIESQLYGVQSNDPLTLAAAALGLVTVAAVAAWIPARRAARVEPMDALRAE